ncbi:hypothetical protein CYMTET_12681 [Cymbomonas tetramitiformis]|uniref:Uncharacterized protein n=1 Tax=Cymbomonas tetramitiformis TaxID=36881 RepID=A0AAE0GK01_9CHLO|nr:hypothetical protein CYMTET_12681 [Cymbomonas tetramitiformis]
MSDQRAIVVYSQVISADQSLPTRQFQLGDHFITLNQDKKEEDAQLSNVGTVVWEGAYVLCEFLLRTLDKGAWAGKTVIDLGAGTGLVGIGLALHGAKVTLTDMQHILPMTQANVDLNSKLLSEEAGTMSVQEHLWGSSTDHFRVPYDMIIGAECLYQPEHFEALLESIQGLSGPNTRIYMSYTDRGRGEHLFTPMLERVGFLVIKIPMAAMHDEYRGGRHHILRIQRKS